MPGRIYDMPARQWRLIVMVAIGAGLLFACVVAFVLFSVTRERPLPFTYEDITPAGAYPRQLCPGEPLRFDLRVTVAEAPSVVLVAENWQSAAGRSIADLSPAWYIQEVVKVAEGSQAVPIPNLPAGAWVYERAGTVNTVNHPALLIVPFTVRGDC